MQVDKTRIDSETREFTASLPKGATILNAFLGLHGLDVVYAWDGDGEAEEVKLLVMDPGKTWPLPLESCRFICACDNHWPTGDPDKSAHKSYLFAINRKQ